MNLTSVVKGFEENGDEEHTEKHQFSASLSVVVKYTLKSSLIALKPHCKLLSVAGLIQIASSILMDGVVIMAL